MANPNIEAAYFWVQIGQNNTNQKFRVKGSDFKDVAKGPEMVWVQRGNDHYWTWYGQPGDPDSPDFSYRFHYSIGGYPDLPGDQRTQPSGDGKINLSLYFTQPGPYPTEEWRNVRNETRTINDLDGKEFKTLNNPDLNDGDVCRITHEGGDLEAWYIVDGSTSSNNDIWLKFKPLYTKSETENRERTDVKRKGRRPDPDGIQVLKFDFYSKEKAQPFAQIADTDWLWAQKDGVKYRVSGQKFKDLFKTEEPSSTGMPDGPWRDKRQQYWISSVNGSVEAITFGTRCDIYKAQVGTSNWALDYRGDFVYLSTAYDYIIATNDTDLKFRVDNAQWKFKGADTSNVQNMASMIKEARYFQGEGMSNWDVSNVQNFNSLFDNCRAFVSDLSAWDTSSATNMAVMFRDCKVYNSDLSGWDVSKVTNARYFASGANRDWNPVHQPNFP